MWERDGKPQTSFEVVASSVGHDLAHGTSTFRRPGPAAAEPVVESVVESVVEPAHEPADEPAHEPRAA